MSALKNEAILLFGGTTEGREMCEFLDRGEIDAFCCVATAYGKAILEEERLSHIHVLEGRLDSAGMKALMQEKNISIVIDATHPYAEEASRNIEMSCAACGCSYIRLLRKDTGAPDAADVTLVGSVSEAVELLENTSGSIFVTTGGRELFRYCAIPDYRSRVFARVLSTPQSAEAAAQLGFEGPHLICMQGPFSTELNMAMMRQCGARYLVTKQSGETGGYPQKEEAARRLGVKMIVVGRPEEPAARRWNPGQAGNSSRAGLVLPETSDGAPEYGSGQLPEGDFSGSMEEVKAYLMHRLGLQTRRTVTLAGIGMGSCVLMTEEVKAAVRAADALIGARRMLGSVMKACGYPADRPVLCEYRAEEIAAWLRRHPECERPVVLLSGDVGFFSGAEKLCSVLEAGGGQEGSCLDGSRLDARCGGGQESTFGDGGGRQGEQKVTVRLLPGISSVQMLAARCHTGWEDAVLLSIHGRSSNVVSAVRRNRKVFCLAGGRDSLRMLCDDLAAYGLSDVKITAGIRLSYPDERILKGTPGRLCSETGSGGQISQEESLMTLLIENPSPDTSVSAGLPDDSFLRIGGGDVRPVPMTKSEVRALSLSKLNLSRGSIVWDIGAGTGSVSVECARLCPEGMVYAVERREDAADLIGQNARRLGASNLAVIRGSAPEALEALPVPTHAFLGGTGGSMREILEVLFRKNPHVRVVINAIALESLAEAEKCLRDLSPDEPEILCVTVAKAKKAGNYHLMTGQNPVWILAAGGAGT